MLSDPDSVLHIGWLSLRPVLQTGPNVCGSGFRNLFDDSQMNREGFECNLDMILQEFRE